MTSGGIDEKMSKWVELGYFPYEIIHKKWQYHLLKMFKEMESTDEMKSLINELYQKYPRGFVAHVTKGKVPEEFRGLADQIPGQIRCISSDSYQTESLLHRQ